MTEMLLLVAGVLIGVLAVLLWLQGREMAPPRRTVPAGETPTQAVEVARQTDPLLDEISEGVLVLDRRLRPRLINRAAARILGLQAKTSPARVPSEEVLALARRARDEGATVEELLNLWYPTRSTIKARAIPNGSGGVIVILDDVTEESLSQKVRKDFVAHASHELKSPVASLQTLAEAVSQAARNDPETVERFSVKMVAEATRLGRLISDLLDLSRLEDAASLPEEPANLSLVAERELAQIRPAAAAKGMQIESHIAPDVWVKGDDQQLGLMVGNLLENAVRYTPEGGKVELRVELQGDSAVTSVTDDGIGIPLEAQGRVFERFYRVDRARSRDRGGTGLGLAIVKHVAELHRGEVSVRSELGEGSTFTAVLPALESQPAADSLAG
ncbi:MAG: sensor histidine kinase [Actinomycetota bacterium]